MTRKSVPPSISETAFDCPHCGAYTTQFWYTLHAQSKDRDHPLPFIPRQEQRSSIRENKDLPEDVKQNFLDWHARLSTGLVSLEKKDDGEFIYNDVNNLHLSRCYNCNKFAVWVHENLLFPNLKQGALPNPDLPDDIVRDIEEARDIVSLSARGAAALLRLSIQKLCIYLGEKGKNIDDDIASLVSKGLNPTVQKSLAIVRVIGNEAVHPGVIDLKDDRDTANSLFVLINAIADQMISHPKIVEEMYQKLPVSKRQAIEKRNQRATGDK